MGKIEKMNEKEMRMKMFGGSMNGSDQSSMMMMTTAEQLQLQQQQQLSRVAMGLGVGVSHGPEPWPARLIPIDLPDSTVRVEVRSAEREIQAKREQTTLAMLVFKRFLPDSASEPDASSSSTTTLDEAVKTRLIPLEDTNEIGASNPTQAAAANAISSTTAAQHTSSSAASPPSPPSTTSSLPVTTTTASTPAAPTAPSHSPPVLFDTSSATAPGSPPPPKQIATAPQVDHILNISSKILPTATAAQSLKTILDVIKQSVAQQPINPEVIVKSNLDYAASTEGI